MRKRAIGFVAQEVQTTLPELVHRCDDGVGWRTVGSTACVCGACLLRCSHAIDGRVAER